jgi:hypothetical protein
LAIGKRETDQNRPVGASRHIREGIADEIWVAANKKAA